MSTYLCLIVWISMISNTGGVLMRCLGIRGGASRYVVAWLVVLAHTSCLAAFDLGTFQVPLSEVLLSALPSAMQGDDSLAVHT